MITKFNLFESQNKPLLAPNGKKSNLTPIQYDLVRTDEFKTWFGDWINSPETSSKILDENGEPLVVYHGTNTSFNIFKPSDVKGTHNEENQLKGIYFTDNKEVAEWYSVHNKYSKSYFLDIKNPLNIKDITQLRLKLNTEDSKIIYDKLISLGYDGILMTNGFYTLGLQKLYLALDSIQIKLADGSNTTFNPNTPDIRF